MTTMIGIDPHKATHTAVAINSDEQVLDEFTLQASKAQTKRLRDWVGQFDDPEWAIESARGLGYLLAPTTRPGARDRVRRAAAAGVKGEGVGFGPFPEERPERRQLGRDCGVAVTSSSSPGAVGPRRRRAARSGRGSGTEPGRVRDRQQVRPALDGGRPPVPFLVDGQHPVGIGDCRTSEPIHCTLVELALVGTGRGDRASLGIDERYDLYYPDDHS